MTHIRTALAELLAAEQSETCGYCRSHIVEVRVLTEDLLRVAELGQDVDRGEVGSFAKRVGSVAERLGALGVLGRIVHKLKGI